MSEYLDKIADKTQRASEILDEAQAQKRCLSEDEKKELKNLEDEILALRYRKLIEEQRLEKRGEDPEEDIRLRFASTAAAALKKGQSVDQELRAINATSVVHDASVPVIYQDLMNPLEKGLILDSLGSKIMYGVSGEPLWRYISGGEASVLGENEEVSDSQLAFTTLKSEPKRIAMSFAVSNTAVNQSNLNLYGVVMEQLAMGVARKLNSIAFSSDAVGAFSGPFVGLTGEQSLTRTGKSGAISFDDIVALEHAVLNAMTDSCGYFPGYVMNYKTAQKLRVTPIVAGQSEMILKMYRDSVTKERWGEMNAHIVKFSNYVPEGQIYFGDFAFLALPQFGDMRITIDPYTLKKKDAVEFTLNLSMDMVKTRKEAFAVSKAS